MRLFVLLSPSSTTSPPRPPSPPLGPPHGSYFSRRKLMQPRPPSPAASFTVHSSTNMLPTIQKRAALPRARNFLLKSAPAGSMFLSASAYESTLRHPPPRLG